MPRLNPFNGLHPHLNRGLDCFREGKLRAARAILDEALAINCSQATAHHLLGLVDFEERLFGDGVDRLQRALELNPRDPSILRNLAFGLRSCGLLWNALRAYDQAIEGRPDFIDARLDRASLNAELGRNVEAIADCTYVLALDPGNDRALSTASVAVRHLAAADA